ncbi:SMU1112c/YaeR family gloxylase I-like metalloprotein [Solitalea canadensis]|uniref:Lactoylglutathione lyase-like lyase n=1 Tax=Solitalea canadensis (strain ATCC 29591 / DSM 3403 / JCM 21819 / LMG 8368 / NBRC 15130 / NCIMB 12057 / USAM 9D) TaxID=929556 RepID=H8KRE5_SOLCM|nr:VOC family protein [Solitalea canadensis]AFD07470.1 lactoylglutathione lyase-like lyase [Solitalea canadensis DSM 3403]
MLKLNKIHHIAIICSDYEKSKSFYCDVLGLSIIQETFRAERESYKLDLALGSNYVIELFSFPDPPVRRSFPEACGLRHLAFEVDDIKSAKEELISKGVTVQEIRMDELTGKQFAFFDDPDGLPLEIYQK